MCRRAVDANRYRRRSEKAMKPIRSYETYQFPMSIKSFSHAVVQWLQRCIILIVKRKRFFIDFGSGKKGFRNLGSRVFLEVPRLQRFHFYLVAAEGGGYSGRDALTDSELHNKRHEHDKMDIYSGITKDIEVLTTNLRLPFTVTPKTWTVVELVQVITCGEWKASFWWLNDMVITIVLIIRVFHHSFLFAEKHALLNILTWWTHQFERAGTVRLKQTTSWRYRWASS